MEPYQVKITKAHAGHKNALVGGGEAKKEPPYTISPSMKRGKSVPPMGEALVQEGGAVDWSKILPLLKKENFWISLEETNYTIIVYLKKDLITVGRFKAELQGFDQKNYPIYASHSNLNTSFHGKFLGSLGYLILIEHITRKRNGTIAPFQTFQGDWGTSDQAKAAWKNLVSTGLIQSKNVLLRRYNKTAPEDSNKITTYFYKESSPPIANSIVSSQNKTKEWSKKIAALIMTVMGTKLLRLKQGKNYYKIQLQSQFPSIYDEEKPPDIAITKFQLKNNKWLYTPMGSEEYRELKDNVKKTVLAKPIAEIVAAEEALKKYFKQLWGDSWLSKADKLIYNVLHQETSDEFKGTSI